MAGWGVDEVTAAGVLERLADLGQVDDRRLAAAVTESRREQGYGRLRTAHDLVRLAVDEPAAAAALATLPDDERPQAERIARQRFGPPPYDDPPPGGRRASSRGAASTPRRSQRPSAVRPWTDRPRCRSGRRSTTIQHESGLAGVVVLSPAQGWVACTGTRLRSARAQLSLPAEAARASARPGGRRRPGRQTDLIPAASGRHVHKETRWSRCLSRSPSPGERAPASCSSTAAAAAVSATPSERPSGSWKTPAARLTPR